jgi:hypothetical protein
LEVKTALNPGVETGSNPDADLKQFIRDYIEGKKWSLRAYCRDTDQKLGPGNGIPVATLSFILRGNMRISVDVARKLAEYHDIPVAKALQMAGYYEASKEPREKMIGDLIALRDQARSFVVKLDGIINGL